MANKKRVVIETNRGLMAIPRIDERVRHELAKQPTVVAAAEQAAADAVDAEPRISGLTTETRNHRIGIEQFSRNLAMRPPGAMVYDLFNRPDTASGLGTSTSGAPWISTTGFQIDDGAAVNLGAARVYGFLNNIHRPNEIEMVVDTPDSGGFDVGPILRMENTGDHLYVSAREVTDNLRLVHLSGGVHTTLAEATAVGWELGRRYTFTVRDEDDTITILVDGVEVLTHTLTVPALLTGNRGRIGITAHGGYGHARIVSLATRRTVSPRRRLFERNVAHRAMTSGLPENSIVSVANLPDNIDTIEIDIKWTSDSAWVCMHDTTVDRTTNGTGLVADLTLAEVQALSITGGGGLVPTLEEMLDAAEEKGLAEVHIHVANGGMTTLAGIVDSHAIADKCVYFCSGTALATIIRDRSPSGRIAVGSVSAANASTEIPAAVAIGAELIYLAAGDAGYTANRAVVADIHTAGMKAGASTVNTAAVMEEAMADGVEVMMTDWGAFVNV